MLWLSIPHFRESGDFQLELPNAYNISFDFVAFIWIVLCCVPLSKSRPPAGKMRRVIIRVRFAHACCVVAARATWRYQNYDAGGRCDLSVVCKLAFTHRTIQEGTLQKMPKDSRRRFSDSDHDEYSPEAEPAGENCDRSSCNDGAAIGAGGVLKPDVSYIEMIARVILSSRERKLCLQDIYDGIERFYPFFRSAPPRWRNSVRHNLSLHECFCKGERCENGKGHYWCIHPANLDDFLRGDFRRRLIKSRVRQMQQCHALYMQYQLAFPSPRTELFQCQVSSVSLRALQQPSFHFVQALPTYSHASMPYIQPVVCYNSQALVSLPASSSVAINRSPTAPIKLPTLTNSITTTNKTLTLTQTQNTATTAAPKKSSMIFSVESILSSTR